MEHERVFRAKGLIDGCSTMVEMAAALERAAAGLRQMAADGVSLQGRVEDDYAFLTCPDQHSAEKHGLRRSSDQGTQLGGPTSQPRRFSVVPGGGSAKPSDKEADKP